MLVCTLGTFSNIFFAGASAGAAIVVALMYWLFLRK